MAFEKLSNGMGVQLLAADVRLTRSPEPVSHVDRMRSHTIGTRGSHLGASGFGSAADRCSTGW